MYRKKRSQVAFFIMGGVILLILASVVIYLGFIRETGVMMPSVEEALERGVLPSLQVYIGECIEKVSPPLFKEIALHSGTLNPLDDIYYYGVRLNYLCYTEGGDSSYSCVNSILLRQNIEDELGREISKEVKRCVDLGIYEKQGYKVEEGEIKTDVIIGKDSVHLEVDYPITMKREDEETKTSPFISDMESPLGAMYELAMDILNSEISNGNFDQDEWMMENNVQFLVEKHRPYPDTIYVITLPVGISRKIVMTGGPMPENSAKLMVGEAEYEFAFMFAIQDHPSVAQKRPEKKSAYGCCVNSYDNVCFKNVPEVLCELNSGAIDTNPECSCKDSFSQSGKGVFSPLDCEVTYEPADNGFTGQARKNGESWCVYDGIVGKGFDLVGSRHYKHTCVNGMQMVEECRDYREELCTEGTEDGMTKAVCRKNRWQDCSQCNSQECCENIDYRDCFWNEGLTTDNKCVPYVPPGLRFWEFQGSEVCFAANSQKECEGLSCPNVWLDDSAIYCYGQGDCGNYRNFRGYLTRDGFIETDIFDDVRGDLVYLNEGYSRNPTEDGSYWKINLPLYETNQPDIMETSFETPFGNIPLLASAAFQFIGEVINMDISDFLNPFTPTPGTHVVDFAVCNLWIPPTIKSKGMSENPCSLCFEDSARPCTEYKCKSLAANCQFEMEKGVPSCHLPEKDNEAPEIEFMEDSLREGYNATDKFVVMHGGVEIQPPIKPHTPFTFAIRTSEPTICKINYAPDVKYYSIPSFWFGDAVFRTSHNMSLRMPPRLSVPEKVLDFLNFTDSNDFVKFVENTVELYNYYMNKLSDEIDLYEKVTGDDVRSRIDKYAGILIAAISKLTPYLKNMVSAIIMQFNKGGYYLFVECIDQAGNENEDKFFIAFTIDENLDDKLPPQIVLTEPENNGRVPRADEEVELKLYLDEPADCRYSNTDRDFNFMENSFDCVTSKYAMSPVAGGTYECIVPLPLPSIQNKVFIRCKDMPLETDDYVVKFENSDDFYIDGMPEAFGEISPYRYVNLTLPNRVDASSKMVETLKFMVNEPDVDFNLYIEENMQCRYSDAPKPFDAMELKFDTCTFSDEIEKGFYKCHAMIEMPPVVPEVPVGKSFIILNKTDYADPGTNNPDAIKIIEGRINITSLEMFDTIQINTSDVTFSVVLDGNLTCQYNPNPLPGTYDYSMSCTQSEGRTECLQGVTLTGGDNKFSIECFENSEEGGEKEIYVKCAGRNITEGNANTKSYEYTLSKAGEFQIIGTWPFGVIQENELDIAVKVSSDIIKDKIRCGYSESLYDIPLNMAPLNENTFSVKVKDLEEGMHQYYINCRDDYGNRVEDIISFEVNN